jgi:hypothetical protein
MEKRVARWDKRKRREKINAEVAENNRGAQGLGGEGVASG